MSFAALQSFPREDTTSLPGVREGKTVYEVYPFLVHYREFFGELSFDQIIGEGNYGLIIRGQTREKVYKIGKTKEFSQMLLQEYRHHLAFYLKLEELRESGESAVPDYFRIPEVAIEPIMLPNGLFIYEMEHVLGMTLNRYDLLKEFPMHLSTEPVLALSDWQIMVYLREVCGVSEEEITLPRARGIRVLEDNFPHEGKRIKSVLDHMRSQGFEHTDLHSGNLMLSLNVPTKPIFIMIDFGKSITPSHDH